MFLNIHPRWSLKFLNTSNLLRHTALTVQHHVTKTDYLTAFLKKMTGGNNKMNLLDWHTKTTTRTANIRHICN